MKPKLNSEILKILRLLKSGIDFTDLLDEMITIGIKDYKKRISKTHSFESNILSGFAANGGVKGMKGVKGKLR